MSDPLPEEQARITCLLISMMVQNAHSEGKCEGTEEMHAIAQKNLTEAFKP